MSDRANSALSVLAQFAIEYADTFKDRPATREAVMVAARGAALVLHATINPPAEHTETGNAGHQD